MPRSYDFEVTLQGARPRVWRRFLLATNATFHDLHDAIQRACGWKNSHLFAFRHGRVEVAGIPVLDEWEDELPEVPDARQVRLAEWFNGRRTSIEYEYDFGDSWIHAVKLLGVVTHDEVHKRKLLDGARAFPPEDCGGLGGYERCVALVKGGRVEQDDDDDDDEDESLRSWLGPWDPERFDVDAVRKKFDTGARAGGRLVVTPAPPPSPTPSPTPSTRLERNAWCEALGVDVPDVAAVAAGQSPFGRVRLSELVVVALVENGGPMTDAEVLDRLRAAGVASAHGDLAKSLKRSVASAHAVLLRDHVGRLTLDLKSDDLDLMLFTLGLREPQRRSSPPPPLPPSDVEPLTRQELEAGYAGYIPASEPKVRFVLAALDAERGPLPLAEVAARYVTCGGAEGRFTAADLKSLARRNDVVVDGEMLRLADDADLAAVRAAVRKRAARTFEAARMKASHEDWKRDNAVRVRAEREQALRWRRAAFVAAPTPEEPTSIEAFDFVRGARVSFGAGELDAFARWIETFDVVVGVRPRLTLGVVGVDVQRFARIVDLLPTKKTLTIDRRQVPIVWSEVVAATLGVPADVNDLGTVVALYRYVLLHGRFWMPAPSGDEQTALFIDAHVAGDVFLHDALAGARAKGETVTVWIGPPPELSDGSPSSRFRAVGGSARPGFATTGRVVGLDNEDVAVVDAQDRVTAVPLSGITGCDITGAVDLAWRLPVTWRP
jgi:hypothetical protein